MLAFPTPTSPGEWLAFASAVVTVIFGLICLLAPRATLRMLRLQTRPESPEALSESRGTLAGFYLGIGLAAIMLAQPLVYMALAAGWFFTAFGRIVSVVADRGWTVFNFGSIALELALAAAPAAYALGYL